MPREPIQDAHRRAYAVLLAGGVGTRLWPVSRRLAPKQLARLTGEDSLIQSTINRLAPVIPCERQRVVCGAAHLHEMRRQLATVGIAARDRILVEPCGRNTAPAVLLALVHILREDADAVVGVFPADHVIGDVADFHEGLGRALALASAGHIVTFGIRPTYPETGYGYIEAGAETDEGARTLKRFVEKPDLATAETYVAAGDFFWNSGMFVFDGHTMLSEFERFQPRMLQRMQAIADRGGAPPRADYEQLPDISIDYAIMEKTRRGVLLPAEFDWSDIGSWKALYDHSTKDQAGNVLAGDVIARHTHGCLVRGTERLVATNRVEGLAVIDTADALFVGDLAGSREVKEIVALLEQRRRPECRHHREIARQWGRSRILEQAAGHRVQRLVIYPDATWHPEGQTTSRTHLSVAAGRGRLTGGPSERALGAGDSLILSAGESVQIRNTGARPLVMIQVDIALDDDR